MRRLLLTFLLLWSTTALADGETLYIIELQHRSADNVMPLLRPLLKPGEGLAGSGQQLLVSMSEPRRLEIERLIASIDVVSAAVALTVRQTGRGITVGEGTRTLQIRDGQRIFVRVGQSPAVVQRIVALTGRGDAVEKQRIQLKDLITGFDVVARTHGKAVLLEVTPRLMGGPSSIGDTFYFQELQMNFPGREGQWIDIGARMAKSSEVNRAILESAGAEPNERVTIQVKVN
jgi:hypothetical protein